MGAKSQEATPPLGGGPPGTETPERPERWSAHGKSQPVLRLLRASRSLRCPAGASYS